MMAGEGYGAFHKLDPVGGNPWVGWWEEAPAQTWGAPMCSEAHLLNNHWVAVSGVGSQCQLPDPEISLA